MGALKGAEYITFISDLKYVIADVLHNLLAMLSTLVNVRLFDGLLWQVKKQQFVVTDTTTVCG